MATDNQSPDSAFPSAPPPLPSLGGSSTSLAQSARLKQLKTARGVMFFLGIIILLIAVVLFAMIPGMVDKEFKDEMQKLQAQGFEFDMNEINELKAADIRGRRIFTVIYGGVGVLYLVLGSLVNKYPVPMTVLGLVIYLGLQVMQGIAEPESIAQGFIIKILIIVALAKAVQAAIAYQKSTNESAMAEFASA